MYIIFLKEMKICSLGFLNTIMSKILDYVYFGKNNIVENDMPLPWHMYFQNPNSVYAEEIFDLHDFVMYFIIIILVAVTWILLGIIISKPVIAHKYIKHGGTIEIVWTLIPAVILLIIAVPSLTLVYLQEVIPMPALSVKAIGYQWYWGYEYSDFCEIPETYNPSEYTYQENTGTYLYQKIVNNLDLRLLLGREQLFLSTSVDQSDPQEVEMVNYLLQAQKALTEYSLPEQFPVLEYQSYMLPASDLEEGQLRMLEVDNRLVLPVDCVIKLIGTGGDVIHDFAVPSLGIKLDCIPGKLSQTGIWADRESIVFGQCSELCGPGHGEMPIAIEIVPLNEFLDWANEQLS